MTRGMRRAALSLALAAVATAGAALAEPAQKIIALGGSVTEIVVALGAEGRLIGRDSTSSWPESVQALPDVGYVRQLSPEGVLSLGPDLIIAESGAGPKEAVEVLKSAGIPYVEVPEQYDPAGVVEKIAVVAGALDLDAEGKALSDRIAAELAAVQARAAAVAPKKRVLFVLSTANGRIMAAGQDTSAEGILRLAGAENAAQGFSGYKPMTEEAVLAAAPDAVLMMDREGEHAIATDDLFAMPAFATSPAAAGKTLIRLNGLLLLGFGPRTPQAATALHDALYPAG